MKVVLSEQAERDLEEIGDFIAVDDPGRARSFVREIRASCAGLASMPRRFPVVGQRNGLAVRRRTHGAYLIFYREASSRVEVIRILHGTRDHIRLLFPED